MINLDQLMDRTIDFKLNGNLIKVKEPSVKTVKKLGAIEDDQDKLVEVLKEILNNNTSAVQFTSQQIEELPNSILKIIINEIASFIAGTEKN